MVIAAKGSQSGHSQLERSFCLVSLVPQGHSLLLCCSKPGALAPPAVGASSKVVKCFLSDSQDQVDWLNSLLCSSFAGNFRNTADVLLSYLGMIAATVSRTEGHKFSYLKPYCVATVTVLKMITRITRS